MTYTKEDLERAQRFTLEMLPPDAVTIAHVAQLIADVRRERGKEVAERLRKLEMWDCMDDDLIEKFIAKLEGE